MLVLGIESVRDGRVMLSSVISSQIEIHKRFGGVVPELASREHLDRIVPVVGEALSRAGVAQEEIDGVAVTTGPGLVGSLIVGVSYAKGLAYALERPVVGVNHIEGHIYSVVFDNPPVEYPALALVVSGGHTNLFYVPEPGRYKVVARTRDDAAGEAFDKVSKMLGLGYPGGPVIERLAREGDPKRFRFSLPQMRDGKPDFSFSGLKTAVSLRLRAENFELPAKDGTPTRDVKDLAASFQAIVVRSLVGTTARVADVYRPRTLIVAGGVACNEALREAVGRLGVEKRFGVYFPSRHLSTDNAAMIAAAGWVKLAAGMRDGFDLNADVALRLQNFDLEDEHLRGRVHYRL